MIFPRDESFSLLTTSYTPISGLTAVLDPAEITIAVGVPADPGVSRVEVFINVGVEDWVEIHKVFITG